MDTELDTFKRVQEGHSLARRRGAQQHATLSTQELLGRLQRLPIGSADAQGEAASLVDELAWRIDQGWGGKKHKVEPVDEGSLDVVHVPSGSSGGVVPAGAGVSPTGPKPNKRNQAGKKGGAQ